MPESCDALQFLSRNGLQAHGADAEVVWEQQTGAVLRFCGFYLRLTVQ